MRKKKEHPADISTRNHVLLADEFSIFQQRHRARYWRDGLKTLAEAAAHADEVEAEDRSRRPCLIYAIRNGVACAVPPNLRAAASAQISKE